MSRSIRKPGWRLSDDDLARVAKQRDRHPDGGGAWQTWQRIYETLQDAKIAQDAIAEQETSP